MEVLILVIVLLAWAYYSYDKNKKKAEEEDQARANKASVSRMALEKFGYTLSEATTDNDGNMKYFYEKTVDTEEKYIRQYAHVYEDKYLNTPVSMTSMDFIKDIELRLEANRLDESDLSLMEDCIHPRAKLVP